MSKIISPRNLHNQVQKADKKASKGLKVKRVDDYMRFVVFLALIGMAYIWNSHLAERQVVELEETVAEVDELKSRYLLKRATLGAKVRFSEIEAAADTLGLRKMDVPPYEIILTQND